jgi:hypothetical protein
MPNQLMMRMEPGPAMASWRLCWLQHDVVRTHISVVRAISISIENNYLILMKYFYKYIYQQGNWVINIISPPSPEPLPTIRLFKAL